jgi:hypothetical protein
VAVQPLLQAIWLADEVSQDSSGKMHVRGMFDCIRMEPGAVEFRSAYLFFALRGVHDSTTVKLVYTDLSDNEVLWEKDIEVSGQPLVTVFVGYELPPLPVPHAGEYVWELWWENTVIGSARFCVFVNET